MSETLLGKDVRIDVESRPTGCPICHRSIRAISRGDIRMIGAAERAAEAVFECPGCTHLFIGYYALPYGDSVFQLQRSEPARTKTVSLGAIDGTSPAGLKIFNQARAAEANGLDEIAGVAYRRALEFFIKDFCIHTHPDKASGIKKDHKLAAVIENYIDDAKLKKAAKMTAWLGNDETHYERRWESKDISDLKKLLSIVVNSINEAIELADYEKEMMPSNSAKPTAAKP